jgi:hypothetical protein
LECSFDVDEQSGPIYLVSRVDFDEGTYSERNDIFDKVGGSIEQARVDDVPVDRVAPLVVTGSHPGLGQSRLAAAENLDESFELAKGSFPALGSPPPFGHNIRKRCRQAEHHCRRGVTK